MSNVKRILPFTIYVLVLISSLLLGLSLDSTSLLLIAFIGATLGFVVTDLLKWFSIKGLTANLASIVILILAMKDFLPEDSTGKLVSVANLLVYLQTVLMFQVKKPGLIWQILILSLLQVVVSAIFSLHFEAGILFVLYFFVIGITMVMQAVYFNEEEVRFQNNRSASLVRKFKSLAGLEPKAAGADENQNPKRDATPIAFFEPSEAPRFIKPMAKYLFYWMIAALVFTSIMFSTIPKTSKPWFSPASIAVRSAGSSKSVDLDERGIIPQANTLIFRVEVEDGDTGELISIEEKNPYFRAMALSHLTYESGQTNWVAPYDRVFRSTYQLPQMFPDIKRGVIQRITLEQSTEPVIYGIPPFFASTDSPEGLFFCHEISALTRCRMGESIELAPYQYEGMSVLDRNNQFSEFWPYISNMDTFQQRPMSEDPPQEKWLTQIEPERYPRLVQTAEQIKARVSEANGNRMDLIKEMRNHFFDASKYSYTLDFRDVERIEGLDPIEDFFGYHRQGHCELYASALTLMLRHAGIPARLVVGYSGAERTPFTKTYMVRAKNAHAWVEAYLRPEDCTDEMLEDGVAGPGGAWMRVDPTPLIAASENNVGEDAIDLARNVWDDYVLGVDSGNSGNSSSNYPFMRFLDKLDLHQWQVRMFEAQQFTKSMTFRYIMLGLGALFLIFFWIRTRFGSESRKRENPIRRLFADAISLIAPGLGQWVREVGKAASPTLFYERMSSLLEPHGLVREPSQTHREFATSVAQHFASHPSVGRIESSVKSVTEWFNQVRFGQRIFNEAAGLEIQNELSALESALKEPVETPREKVNTATEVPAESDNEATSPD